MTSSPSAYFKTPEGLYKLHYEKTRPLGLPFYSHAKSISQITLARFKEKPAQAGAAPSSSASTSSRVRYAAARPLGVGGGNGGHPPSFVGGNGTSTSANVTSRSSSLAGSNGSHSMLLSNYDDGKGAYLIFNVGDALFFSELNSPDKDPIKSIHFSNSNPICHAFDPEAKDRHDLLIGLHSGDVYSLSLRQQLQDVGKQLVGAQHYNKEGSVSNSRCTSVAWVPKGDGAFVVAHADGNLYVYKKGKDGTVDSSFPVIKDQTQFSVVHAKSSEISPISRWHICQGSINSIAFSADGAYLATVGRDGYLRVFDYSKEQLICGGKSYYGALLCIAWSFDGKYILTGGEDDLVTVWSMEDRKVVAWGEGHNSWVSGVAFDSYWSSPTSDGSEENVMYRFGSVGQDTQLILWDLSKDEIQVPLCHCPPGGSPTFSTGSQSSHWDSACPVGTIRPAPSMRDVPKLSPLIAHRAHLEPLSGLTFTEESVLTACWGGHVKIWMRPGNLESQSNNSEVLVGSGPKGQLLLPVSQSQLHRHPTSPSICMSITEGTSSPADFSDSSPTPTPTPNPTPDTYPTDPSPNPTETTPCPTPKPTQNKKLVSTVWSHFTKLEDGDPNNPQAKCNYCGKIYECQYKKHGTSQLKVHLEEHCKKSAKLRSLQENFGTEIGLKQMSDGSSGGSTLKGYTKYDPDECGRMLAGMVIMDELPFQFVERRGFQEYSNTLELRFNIPSRHTVAKDIKKHYTKERDLLKGQLASQVVCLATNTWTSVQNFNYMSLTVHFINCDWKLHKKIIKCCQISDHKGETVGKALEAAVKEWGLARVLTVTVDNASSNDVPLGYLKTYLREANKTVLGGDCLHVKGAIHILNLIVTDGLKEIDDLVARVRMAVRFVRSSPVRLEKFKVVARNAGITSKKGLCFDVPTRWNSTFLMLETAQEYKAAFQLLGAEDIQYVKYFDEHGGLRKPIDDDWEVVATFVDFLRLFYEVTLKLSSSLYPTSNEFCQQICRVKEKLYEMCRGDHFRIREIALTMRVKYDKYWGDLSRVNILLYVAVALDPQVKIDGMVYGLGLTHGKAWAEFIGEMVRETLDKLFDEFTVIKGSNASIPTLTSLPPPKTGAGKKRGLAWGESLSQNPILVRQSTEVDRYLAGDLLPYTSDFDILAWWKINVVKYPILGEIARCILAIPISTVVSESAFNTGGHILDPFQSSLSATTVEVLICMQSWMMGKEIYVSDVLDFKETDEEDGSDQPGSAIHETTSTSVAV
ncbi:hypothetical protein I3760_13G109300 [Carya illinoinensis]|nr:hypothetical protein I3760_13G109300 [Carya illinoinensis]KAG2673862.1 hypothetical protein I3760_13G109300 [Carya illinoinensis]KAG2673863.1 hypothetical protein I3760_13G109300 [Carya illinoinensis]KAG2673864.1 hypothetical protein I3760_13G109300 [Carya illinoinensis]KAG2673865.1 hypothetical protein I3760_13G109300 [Carya illinoinensis]